MPAPIEPVRDGLPVEFLGRVINRLIREVNRWNRASSDGRIGFSNGSAGPNWSLDDDGGTTIRTVHTPTGGIPAMVGTTPGSAECTRYVWDGTAQTLGTEEMTVLNDFPGAVAEDVKLKVYYEDGAWWALVEACPT